MQKKLLSFVLGLFVLFSLQAQKQSFIDAAFRHIEQQAPAWGLSASDITDLSVNDEYRTAHNGVRHIYLRQRYQGLPVFGALAGVHLRPDGQVLFSNHRFLPQLASRATATQPNLSPGAALQRMAELTKGDMSTPPEALQREGNQRVRYSGGSLSTHAINIQLEWFPLAEGTLRLAWSGVIVEPRGSDAWLLHLDAMNGQLLHRQNLTISCSFEHSNQAFCPQERPHLDQKALRKAKAQPTSMTPELADGAQYRVFPANVESPIFGQRQLIVNPADETASPYGWHDVDGRSGSDFTITRGNNVHAYLDLVPDNTPDQATEPDGGPELIFDFPFNDEEGPDANEDAVLTQLFYMNNFMHDFTYYYGFDEEAGNFQQFNYGRGGRGTDQVRAEGQDGSALNNANFFTPGDGDQPRMQMFLWASAGGSRVAFNSPSLGEGTEFSYGSAAFGPLLRSDFTGNIVEVFSMDFDPSLGCSEFFNANQINGNIALISRGECAFEQKVRNAEEAGATGVIIVNTEDNVLVMGGVDTLTDPSIPAILVPSSAGAQLRSALDSDENVEATVKVPDYLDSGFDNGIIAHEYAHGISNRLTGGPSEAFCLFNDEQMGEGWSDFFTLVTSVAPDDNGNLPRGIGNYVIRAGTNGPGIRRQPYSTNFNINNQTYDDIIGTRAPHPLGEIWAATLWDLYWALVDRYGWDPDIYQGAGGNNIAIQLVMDGMKLQACRPGFIDGRDAILAADAINNNGENECLIWEVFARRGLGWNAQQGIAGNRNDNIQNFDIRPECIKTLKIEKESTPLIAAGDTFAVHLYIQNDKDEPATDVVITDPIPEGAIYIAGSLQGGEEARLENNNLIVQVGDLLPGQRIQVDYTLQSVPEKQSISIFTDDMESGAGGWRLRSFAGPERWRLTQARQNSGKQSWYIPNLAQSQDQTLQSLSPILLEGGKPVLRFFHAYEIEPGLDGGVLDISTDGGFNWEPLPDSLLFREEYTGRLAPATINNAERRAFWGITEEFVATYVDLSPYVGSTLNFRFRFAANDGTLFNNPPVTDGWYVDDVHVFDMAQYQSVACATSAQGDNVCTPAKEGGTIVAPTNLSTSTRDLQPAMDWTVYPNPASEQVNIQVSPKAGSYQMELMTIDGRVVRQWQGSASATTLNADALQPGMYVLQLKTESGSYTKKLIIE